MSVPTDTRAFKVTAVSERTKDWGSTQGGPMRSYWLRLEGVDLNAVELAQKAATPAPAVGQEIYGRLESRQHGENTYWKLKKQQQQGGYRAGGGKDFKADPAKQAAISVMASFNSALEFHKTRLTMTDGPRNLSLDEVLATADALYGRVQKAMSEVAQ